MTRDAILQMAREAGPVAWLYTLEYGATTVDTKVSLHQLRYPFGVCGADYLRVNDDGVSYVRETPLHPRAMAQDMHASQIQGWEVVIPGGRATDKWESARVADYNQGWNDYRKAVKAALSKLAISKATGEAV